MNKNLNKEIDYLMKNAQLKKDQGNLKDARFLLEQILKIDQKKQKSFKQFR